MTDTGGDPLSPAPTAPLESANGPATAAPMRRRGRSPADREHRRRRRRRRGRRAYIRSVYFLPSMATLGNAICGFAAMYVCTLSGRSGDDLFSSFVAHHSFSVAAYLIFLAMVFDALDGRLARFTRHTTDFGGQLDSLADVISFGAAPAFLSLLLFNTTYVSSHSDFWAGLSRIIWVISALFMSCAALRLARFNVSNEHGEQHHFSFLGLPSPAAGGTVAAWVLMLKWAENLQPFSSPTLSRLVLAFSDSCTILLPLVVLATGLLMISNIRYPHLVNRYLRGRRSIGRLLLVLVGLLMLFAAHQLVIAIAMIGYVCWGATSAFSRYWRTRRAAV